MIAKLIKGRGARGLLEYLLGPKDHNGEVRERVALLGGTLPGETPRDLARAFGGLKVARPDLGVYVTHAILNWDTAAGDAPDEAAQLDMMTRHMEALGYQDFVVISHGDHVHAAACRIRRDGKTVPDRWDWRTAENSCRSLEEAFGLRRLASSWEDEPTREGKPRPLTKGELGMLRRTLAVAGVEPSTPQAAKARAWTRLYGEAPPADLVALLRYVDTDSQTVRLTDGSWVRDHGDRLTLGRVTEASVRLCIAEAKAKGWPGVVLTGDDDFKAKGWLEAQRQGVTVEGYDPPAAVRLAWEEERKNAGGGGGGVTAPQGDLAPPVPIRPGAASAELPTFPTKPELVDLVLAAREAALADGGTISAFLDRLRLVGVAVRPNWSPASRKVSGLSFFLSDAPEVEVSGSKLARSLSWANLLKGGFSYEPERDGPRIGEAAERAAHLRPDRAPGRPEGPGGDELPGPGRGVPPTGGDDGRLDAGRGLGAFADDRPTRQVGEQLEPPGAGHGRDARPDGGFGPVSGGGGGAAGGGDSRGPGAAGQDGRGRPEGGDRGGPQGHLAADGGAGRGGKDERGPDGGRIEADGGRRRGPDEGGAGGAEGSDADSLATGGRGGGGTAGDWRGDAFERVMARGAGGADPGVSRTLSAVEAAVRALGGERFLVGIMPPRGEQDREDLRAMNRRWTADQVTHEKAIRFLRVRNAEGHDIYIRPDAMPDGRRPPVVLVDDLSPEGVERMRRDGREPCLVVSTSARDRLQAWVRVGTEPLDPAEARQVARILARTYGGDPLAASSEQFGRLPGYTNRKRNRIEENGGQPPFARVLDASGQTASAGAALVTEARREILAEAEAKRQAEAETRRLLVARVAAERREQAAEDAHQAMHRHWLHVSRGGSGSDLSRVDFGAACGALRDGHSPGAVAEALRRTSPDLAKRHNDPELYIARTIAAASAAVAQQPPRPAYRGPGAR